MLLKLLNNGKIVLLVYFITLILMWSCMAYRKNDFITGAYLAICIFLPTLLIEGFLLLISVALKNKTFTGVAYIIIHFVFISTLIFSIYYFAKGR